jgi:NAD(P)-dependent dehydrogenase (short-subunit alcohol dehydrogenase family)
VQRLQGRVVLITGGSRGIGLAIAERVVSEGARVVITGRDQGRLDAAVAGLGGVSHAHAVAGKVDDREHQAATAAAAMAWFGGLDALVNNAAVSPGRAYGPLAQLDLELASRVLDANVLAALGWTQAALAAGGLAQPGAAIVNISSAAWRGPTPGLGLYGLSKSALVYLSRQLASELAPRVRVNVVSPATVRTRMSEGLIAGREEAVADSHPMKRIGEPSDISAAVAYLCSDEAAWVTGVNLDVDGGLSVATS